MDRSQTKGIKEVLSEFLRQNKLDVKLKERRLVESWEEIVGKTISRSTRNIYIKDKKLFIYLSSSVVRNELFMLKDEILKKLNEKAGEEIIQEIIFK